MMLNLNEDILSNYIKNFYSKINLKSKNEFENFC